MKRFITVCAVLLAMSTALVSSAFAAEEKTVPEVYKRRKKLCHSHLKL